ncbi:MAG: FxsA family protein [Bacillaceae bacterium]
MFKWILALLIAIPLLELYIVVKVGLTIGIFPTVGLCLLTAIIGGSLAKKQGLAVLLQLRQEIESGYNPTETLLNGACILVGGIMLLFPGFFSDVIGFILLLPFTRTLVKNIIRREIDKKMVTRTAVYRERKDITDYK